MKELVIIGAGGMGRTFFDWIRESIGYGKEFIIKGFIDDNLHALDGFENYPPMLGMINEYIPQQNDVFTCSMGGNAKKICCEKIVARGGVFRNIIHSTARVGTNVKLGTGNVVGAYVALGADSRMGNYNLIQSYSIVGHDAIIGDWNRIDTHVTCVGGIKIEDEATIHTSAVLNHKVVIGNRAKVAACSFVIRKVKEGTTVMGNPAKIMSL
ncbi:MULTISPECIES: PglD-related sugar-binding protein [Butyricimonas]|uniref:PglD-related sugar-binding protein n=1 Tax=Butyricimonas TaxID=574697 RepID=UPI0007FB2151|nr:MULTISPECIES: sialic acid O-acetyltransferase [Butyricimonas]